MGLTSDEKWDAINSAIDADPMQRSYSVKHKDGSVSFAQLDHNGDFMPVGIFAPIAEQKSNFNSEVKDFSPAILLIVCSSAWLITIFYLLLSSIEI
jgi:hypothetical protein